MTLRSIYSWMGRFLELRLRAFTYALFTLVGFMLGVIVATNLTLAILAQYQ
jgi:hypothetical protein